MKIKYDGAYPNLCSGNLVVIINGVTWNFPSHCLKSGGGVWFDENWSDHVESGPWRIEEWPDGFPEEMKESVVEMVNETVPHGCCGGCI